MKQPDSQMQAVLDAHAAMNPLPIEQLTVEAARQMPLADRAALAVYGQHFIKRAFAPMPTPVGRVAHHRIAGAGSEILLRVYTPTGVEPEDGWPTLVYYHGGGWVLATLDTYDGSCRALCEGASCVVVSVSYRQAPEHPFPAAVQDALAAYEWVTRNSALIDGDPRYVAIAGESAGGNLAAVVSLLAKETNLREPIHQLLVYPVTDLQNGTQSASAREFETAKPLNTAMLNWFYDHYAPTGVDRSDPRVSPLNALELSAQPATTMILAEIDPLRSDGEAYAKRLYAAGVPVNLKVFEGVTHEFFGMGAVVDQAAAAMVVAVNDLREAFKLPRLMPTPLVATTELVTA